MKNCDLVEFIRNRSPKTGRISFVAGGRFEKVQIAAFANPDKIEKDMIFAFADSLESIEKPNCIIHKKAKIFSPENLTEEELTTLIGELEEMGPVTITFAKYGKGNLAYDKNRGIVAFKQNGELYYCQNIFIAEYIAENIDGTLPLTISKIARYPIRDVPVPVYDLHGVHDKQGKIYEWENVRIIPIHADFGELRFNIQYINTGYIKIRNPEIVRISCSNMIQLMNTLEEIGAPIKLSEYQIYQYTDLVPVYDMFGQRENAYDITELDLDPIEDSIIIDAIEKQVLYVGHIRLFRTSQPIEINIATLIEPYSQAVTWWIGLSQEDRDKVLDFMDSVNIPGIERYNIHKKRLMYSLSADELISFKSKHFHYDEKNYESFALTVPEDDE